MRRMRARRGWTYKRQRCVTCGEWFRVRARRGITNLCEGCIIATVQDTVPDDGWLDEFRARPRVLRVEDPKDSPPRVQSLSLEFGPGSVYQQWVRSQEHIQRLSRLLADLTREFSTPA